MAPSKCMSKANILKYQTLKYFEIWVAFDSHLGVSIFGHLGQKSHTWLYLYYEFINFHEGRSLHSNYSSVSHLWLYINIYIVIYLRSYI